MGWALFAFLNLLAMGAAISVAVRSEPSGRAELGLTASIIWCALVTVPVLALGWMNKLDAGTLAVASMALSLLTLAASTIGTEWRDQLRRTWLGARQQLRLPIEAIAAAWQARSFTLVALIASAVIILWTGWLSYLASSGGWDGIWYHESIVGYAIQNRGFRVVDVPQSLEFVNGFPKACEMVNLWFVIFTDRRLIEAVQSFLSPALMLSVYVLARRYSFDRIGPMAWAAALLLTPGIVNELRSTYIDVQVALYALAALHYCTRPTLRLRDAWLAALTNGLLLASKGHALAWAPPMLFIVLLRLTPQLRRRPGALFATILGGTAAIVAIAGPTYIRNWMLHDNPLWPISFEMKHLGVHWKGTVDVSDLNIPFGKLVEEKLAAPVPGHDFHDTRVYGYGLGIPWLVVPIALLALPLLFVSVFREWFGSRNEVRAMNLLVTLVPAAIAIPLSPELWSARYNINVVASAMLLVQWAATRFRARAFNDSAASVCVATGIMMLYWAFPRWTVTFDEAMSLAGKGPSERLLFPGAVWSIQAGATASRERDLGPGDVAIYTDDYEFPALLWNEHLSNRVVYVPYQAPDEFMNQVDRLHAKWVVVSPRLPVYQSLEKRPDWEPTADVATNIHWLAFRRK